MPIFDHFNWVAPFYDHVIPLKHADQLLQYINTPDGGLVLDAGGGTGRVAEAIKSKANQVIVADVSMGMLQEAYQKPGLRIVCSKTEELPFPPNTFDRVIMVDALHHVYDQRQAIDEMWRVLKPGGRLVIEEPDLRKFLVKLIAVVEKLALMRSHFLAPNKIASIIPRNNLGTQIIADHFNAWVISEKE